ncbi:MAG TPA: ABC transporter permease, partial [Arcobacter sp.]|nr:ABC transporter permease [Arcobacter sp.]
MSLTFLWTDIMVWLLVFSLIALGYVVGRSPQVQKQWRAIFKSSIAMVSAIVLLVYVLFALLDSVHFHKENSTQMVSLLDMAFEHRINNTERTYSAPFATVEYAKSIVSEDGISKQVNLPLKYVNNTSIMNETLFALLVGLVLSIFLIGTHMLWQKRKAKPSEIPWNVAYITISLLVMTFTWLYMLSFDYHVLGTDKVGGDVLYQSLKSIRTGVLIGILTTLVTLPLAIFLGISAGLFRGWVDDVIQYIYTTLNSIPSVLLIAAAVLLMQVVMDNNPQWFETTQERSDIRLLFLVLILGITSWTGLCRLLRAETLKISQIEFVTAAKAFGVGKMTIIRKHVLPNLMHIVLIAVVLDFSGLVLAE